MLDRREHARGEVEAIETVPALDQVGQQQRRTIRPPVERDHLALQVGRKIGPRTGRGFPDRRDRLADRSWITASRPSPATGDHAAVDRPFPSSRRSAITAAVRGSITRSAGCSMSPPSQCCRHSRAPSADNPPRLKPLRSRHAEPIGAADRLLRRPAVDRHVHGEAVTIADRGSHDARRLSEAFVPPDRDAVQEWTGVTARERRRVPASRLVARLVLPPQGVGAVDSRSTR